MTLWSLDRVSFRLIVLEANARKTAGLETIIEKDAKLLASLLLLAPCFREVKKLSRKLQFTAEVRKAEVRRMSAAGAEFMVKRASKAAGQDSDAAVATMKKLTDDKERRAALLKQMAKQSLFIAAIQGERTNRAGRSSRVSWGDSASARSSARYAVNS